MEDLNASRQLQHRISRGSKVSLDRIKHLLGFLFIILDFVIYPEIFLCEKKG